LENEFSCDPQAFDELRVRRDLICFGEKEPLVNAETIVEEIEIASEFSAALNGQRIYPGQTPRSFISNIFDLWVNQGCSAFSRKTKKFSLLVKFDIPNIDKYVWPDGADEPYQPAAEK
jgi:hypothetical protein